MANFWTPLDDLKPREMPPREKSFWKMVGPGAVMVGLAIGAGEIVIWPKLTADYGACMAWAAVIGVMLQVWINFEVGRWTIATGETVFTGYARVWRGFAPLFILLTIMGWLAPGWARVSGSALKALLVGPNGWGSDTAWTCITFAMVAALLFGPKVAYKAVELSIELMVAIVTIGMICVAVAVGSAETWKELGAGVMNVGYKHPDVTVKQLFIALVFAGAGGTANLFYSFYLRDKQIGMAAHVPTMKNPLRSDAEAIPATGFTFAETEENKSRFRAWFDYVRKDTLCIFWVLNTVTIMLFIFGSLAVLHKSGKKLNEGSLIWDEAQVLGQVWGEPGRIIFLLVGVATLFSTQLALVDGVSRSIADICYTNFTFARKRSVSWWYMVIAAAWIFLGCAITYVMEQRKTGELGFLFSAAYMGGFAMAIYVPLTLYINVKFLPKCARPGKIVCAINIVISMIYISFAVACVLWELGLLPK